jgi:DNA modification methylase/rubredoxin
MSKNEEIKCLGKSFASEDERRDYFRKELRKKLPELKKVEGFPIGEDEDILNLSDPPYYTACPNPWLNEFIEEWEEEKDGVPGRKKGFKVDEPYAGDVSEGKYDPIYLYHPYPTKVPHKAIMRYIMHYTQPGDIVFDGFSGTGMTGVAAQQCYNPDGENKLKIENDFRKLGFSPPNWGKRRAICGDLSPLASFISFNYNTPGTTDLFVEEAKGIIEKVENNCGWMFETHHTNGKPGRINYTTWSDVFSCPDCNGEIIFWEAAVDKAAGKVKETFKCPHCKSSKSKSDLDKAFETIYDETLKQSIKRAKTVPVLINYSFAGKRFEKKPDANDLALITKISETKIPYWFPHDRMPDGDESRRNDNIGVTHVHHFYSIRNLHTLAKLKELCLNTKYNILITKVAFQITKLYRLTYQNGVWGAGGGPLSGTLYVPSLIKELNVLNQLSDAIESKKRIRISALQGSNLTTVSSNTLIKQLLDNTIDYIFTDPPFGANLMYSELNYLAESWLKVRTNNIPEAIENKTQNKSHLVYQELMTACFSENFRILKPGKWMTVEFSNTSAAVWNGIQTALQRAGFIIANVAALDKQKITFKAVTTPTAVKQDLVISCYKPNLDFQNKWQHQPIEMSIWDFIQEHLKHLPIIAHQEQANSAIIERAPKILYDRLISFYLMRGMSIPLDATDFQIGLKQKFVERDGMYFTHEQVVLYDEQKAKQGKVGQLSLIFDTIYSETDAVLWLKDRLGKEAQTYQDIMTDFRKANVATRKGEREIELKTVLEENFIQDAGALWRLPNMNEAKDRERLRIKGLLKEFDRYVTEITNPKTKKLKEVRVEALRAGFRSCFDKKDFQTIVTLGDKIPQNLLLEDEQLLMFYDIAKDRI